MNTKLIEAAEKFNKFAESPAAAVIGLFLHTAFVGGVIASGFAPVLSFTAFSLVWRFSKYAIERLLEGRRSPLSIDAQSGAEEKECTLRIKLTDEQLAALMSNCEVLNKEEEEKL